MKYIISPIAVSLMLCSVNSYELEQVQEVKGLTQVVDDLSSSLSTAEILSLEDDPTTAGDSEES